MTGTDGLFSLALGSGVRTASDPGLSFATIFANNVNFTGLSACTSGSSYNPSAGDGRLVRMSFSDGSQIVTITPDYMLGSVPYASVAHTVQGKNPSDFVQVNTASGKALSQANLETVFQSSAFVTELLALINGTFTQYAIAGGGGGNFNFGSGKLYVDGTSGNVGIGTATPSKLLDITQSQNAATSVLVTNSNAGASAQATLGAASDSGSTTVSSVSTAGGGYGRVVSTSSSLALDAQNASGFLSLLVGEHPPGSITPQQSTCR
jgi:hypothetical protein